MVKTPCRPCALGHGLNFVRGRQDVNPFYTGTQCSALIEGLGDVQCEVLLLCMSVNEKGKTLISLLE